MNSIISILLSLALYSDLYSQGLTKDQIKVTCDVLVELTDEALREKDSGKVAVYSTTFRLVVNNQDVDKKYEDYFRDVYLNNSSWLKKWVVSSNRSPDLYQPFKNVDKLTEEELIELGKQIELLKKQKQ